MQIGGHRGHSKYTPWWRGDGTVEDRPIKWTLKRNKRKVWVLNEGFKVGAGTEEDDSKLVFVVFLGELGDFATCCPVH